METKETKQVEAIEEVVKDITIQEQEFKQSRINKLYLANKDTGEVIKVLQHHDRTLPDLPHVDQYTKMVKGVNTTAWCYTSKMVYGRYIKDGKQKFIITIKEMTKDGTETSKDVLVNCHEIKFVITRTQRRGYLQKSSSNSKGTHRFQNIYAEEDIIRDENGKYIGIAKGAKPVKQVKHKNL